MITRLLVLLSVLALLAGCASAPPASGRAASAPRARCLANPNETTMRPLIFLFCIESP